MTQFCPEISHFFFLNENLPNVELLHVGEGENRVTRAMEQDAEIP